MAWLPYFLHTQYKEVSPSLLHSTLGYTFPSSALEDVHSRFTIHSYPIVRFHTRFIKHILCLSHSQVLYIAQTQTRVHNTTTTRRLYNTGLLWNTINRVTLYSLRQHYNTAIIFFPREKTHRTRRIHIGRALLLKSFHTNGEQRW